MSGYLLENQSGTRLSSAGSSLYDLAAVIVHHGSGTGSGHYTAFATNNKVTLDIILKSKADLFSYLLTQVSNIYTFSNIRESFKFINSPKEKGIRKQNLRYFIIDLECCYTFPILKL